MSEPQNVWLRDDAEDAVPSWSRPTSRRLTKKLRWGMPFHRLALELASEGDRLDDSTMCR